MAKWHKPLLFSSLIGSCAVTPVYADCSDVYSSRDRIERQKQFIESRDQLIGHLLGSSPEENARIIVDVIRHSTAASNEKVQKHALWLRDIPTEIRRHAEVLQLSEQRAREISSEFESEIDSLEQKAICYHFNGSENYGGDRLMMLKLYEDETSTEKPANQQNIAFGYTTTLPDGRSSPVVHFTYPGYCSNQVCHFQHMDKKEFSGTGVRLVHHPEVVESMVTELSSTPVGEPEVTDLTVLELNKTGEIFTTPEIYAAVYYYGDEVKIDEDSFDRRMMVDIPWALFEGSNSGRTRLLKWQNQSKAHVVIMEDDQDLPFSDMQNVIKLAFKLALELSSEGSDVINFAESLNRVVTTKDTKGNHGLFNILAGWQEDDLIDELVLERNFNQNNPQSGKHHQATMSLSNMYKASETPGATENNVPDDQVTDGRKNRETLPVSAESNEIPVNPDSEQQPGLPEEKAQKDKP